MQDRHPCVSFCPKQFHSSAHQVLSPWNTSIAFKNTPWCFHNHRLSRWQRSPYKAAPSELPMPSTAPQPSKVLTGFAALQDAPPRDPPGATSEGRWSISAGWGGSPQQGSTFPEVPTSLQLKYQQWVKSFQWTVKHNKTAALFPNQKLASLYRENCIPKHEGQLIWKFILVFSNLPVCLHTGQNKYDGQK